MNNGGAGIAAVCSHGFSGIFCLREMCFILQSCVLFEGKQRCMLTLDCNFSICVFVLPEEKFAQAVCFLLVDLYILTHQAEKALHLLAVLEKMISQGSGNKNGKSEVSAGHWVGSGTSVCCVMYPAAHGDSIHRDAVIVCLP